ncbi:MAG: hypothetical protein ABSD78_01720 [Acidimicrobiales bacterium]
MRRLTNWSLAALLVGVGATSATLAHVIPGHTSPAVYSASPSGGSAAGTPSGKAPALSGAVASSNPSQVVAGGGVTASGQGSSQPGVVSSGSTRRDS